MLNGLIDSSNGTQRWFLNDELHRDNDLPAIICADGSQAWYRHGKCHRDNDLPAIIYASGSQIWYHHGQWHRDNGPALIRKNGQQEWYIDSKQINVNEWIELNQVVVSWESWDDVTWSLFRLEFL